MRILFALFSMALAPLAAQDGVAYYEQNVRPLLKARCLGCHSEKMLSSGLSLETRESILRGANRGPVVSSTTPQDSNLLKAVRHEGDVKMPPGPKLKDEQIAVLEKWVAMGVPMPRSAAAAKRPGSDHWAYQAPKKVPPPGVRNEKWPINEIDRFVLAKLDAAQLTPSKEAPRAKLLRRVHLDLTGLPPTVAEIQAFEADTAPGAYERVVDKLLASPHYGERWGRHWLDIARYADSDGYTIDAPRDIWKYRDWVIDATNQDMPFDRFVTEQLAGDLLPEPTTEQLVATGFHRNTPSNYEGGIDFEQYRVEAVADRVSTTGAAFLGLTLGCARCHDHKFDPISQREFYQLFAIYNNVDEVDKEADRKDHNKPFLTIGTDQEKAAFAAWEKEFYKIEGDVRKLEDRVGGDPSLEPQLKAARQSLTEHRKKRPKLLRTMIMRELAQPRASYIHLGGDFTRKGAAVEPGVLGVLNPLDTGGKRATRLDLANWLMDKRNPLTSRVTVNRIWQKYFGRGIVDTEADFGTQGEKPTHLELLDWLALRFQESGWSQKAMHRLIVTSAAYRQDSAARPDAAKVDPENRLLARQSRLRLDAEIIRDSSLVASGLFAPEVGGPSVYPPLPPGANDVTQVKREWLTSTGKARYRRAMYTFFQRSAAHPGLLVFDAPDASVACTRRIRSNTPLQALISMNDEAAIEFAEALGRQMREAGETDADRVRNGWIKAMGREPRPDEVGRLIRLAQTRRDSKDAEPAVWTAVARVLMNVDEFLTRP